MATTYLKNIWARKYDLTEDKTAVSEQKNSCSATRVEAKYSLPLCRCKNYVR